MEVDIFTTTGAKLHGHITDDEFKEIQKDLIALKNEKFETYVVKKQIVSIVLKNS